MSTRLAIIILHYKNYQETMACARCALAQKGKDYEIIIVDNGSGDGSYEILKQEFKNTPHLTIKKLKKNLGFARGNNAGIRYARTHFNAKNCFVCNSDVVFEDTLFEELLAAPSDGIGCLSPAVYDTEGSPQPLSINMISPYKTIIFTLLYLIYKSLPQKLKRKLLLEIGKLLYLLIKKGISGLTKLRAYLKKEKRQQHQEEIKEETATNTSAENPFRMQGCAFMLTEEYFKNYRGLYPKTFLYGEELNVSLYLKKAGLLAATVNTSPVIHKGGQSSMKLLGEEGDKKRLMLARRSLLHSLPLLFLSSKNIRRFY